MTAALIFRTQLHGINAGAVDPLTGYGITIDLLLTIAGNRTRLENRIILLFITGTSVRIILFRFIQLCGKGGRFAGIGISRSHIGRKQDIRVLSRQGGPYLRVFRNRQEGSFSHDHSDRCTKDNISILILNHMQLVAFRLRTILHLEREAEPAVSQSCGYHMPDAGGRSIRGRAFIKDEFEACFILHQFRLIVVFHYLVADPLKVLGFDKGEIFTITALIAQGHGLRALRAHAVVHGIVKILSHHDLDIILIPRVNLILQNNVFAVSPFQESLHYSGLVRCCCTITGGCTGSICRIFLSTILFLLKEYAALDIVRIAHADQGRRGVLPADVRVGKATLVRLHVAICGEILSRVIIGVNDLRIHEQIQCVLAKIRGLVSRRSEARCQGYVLRSAIVHHIDRISCLAAVTGEIRSR